MPVTTDDYLVEKAMGPYAQEPFAYDDPADIKPAKEQQENSECDDDFEVPF